MGAALPRTWAFRHHLGPCAPTLSGVPGVSPCGAEGIQEHTMPRSHHGHTTQIAGLPGEPVASEQNMPPSVGHKEMPGEGVRERERDQGLGDAGSRHHGQERKRREKRLEGSQSWEESGICESVQGGGTEEPQNPPSEVSLTFLGPWAWGHICFNAGLNQQATPEPRPAFPGCGQVASTAHGTRLGGHPGVHPKSLRPTAPPSPSSHHPCTRP